MLIAQGHQETRLGFVLAHALSPPCNTAWRCSVSETGIRCCVYVSSRSSDHLREMLRLCYICCSGAMLGTWPVFPPPSCRGASALSLPRAASRRARFHSPIVFRSHNPAGKTSWRSCRTRWGTCLTFELSGSVATASCRCRSRWGGWRCWSSSSPTATASAQSPRSWRGS